MPADNIIQFRQGTASQWSAVNPVLSNGEMGYETDTRRSKTGDGTTAWNSLTYNILNPSGLLAGSGINIALGSNNSTATISVSGLNSSYISNFNTAVSGLLPTISNSGDNRVLTSTGSTVGINAESNLVFDGSRLGVNVASPSGSLHVIGSGLISSVTGIAPNSLWHLYSATSGDRIFNVEGTNGSLFSVDDNLSGTLMSVNNNAGLPVFEVFSDDRVVGGRFNQNDFVINSSGNIGIGNSGDNSYKFNVTGNTNFNGAINISGVPLSEIIDDEVAGLLSAGSGISLSYNDAGNVLTISTSGLQPSGNYASFVHTHSSSDITNFNTSVSGLVNGIYAPLNSPTFTGIPSVPTATGGTNTNQIASTSFVRTEISNLVSSAPSALDTLNELATALGNDPNFATTVTNSLANKANLSGAIFSGSIIGPSGNFIDLRQSDIPVSVSGHTHTSSNITDFNTSVSGLLTVTNITGNSGIVIDKSGTTYNVSSSGLAYLSGANFSGSINAPSGSFNKISVNAPYNGEAIRIEGTSEAGGDVGFAVYNTHGYQANSFYFNTDGDYFGIGIGLGASYIQSNVATDFSVPSLTVNSIPVSISGHTHTSSDISDFSTSVSGLLPVTNILGGTNISVVPSGSSYTVNVSGSLGLTTEEVDDRVSNLLVAGSGISLDYNDGLDALTIHNISISPDELEEYIAFTNLPASGNVNILYRTTDDGRIYQWSGSVYAEIGPDSVTTGSHASQHYTNGIDPILNIVSRPATLTATVNNYAHNNADIIYLNADANRIITGLASATDGTVKLLINSSLYTITLDHQDTNSNPENRFMVPFGSDYVLQPGYSITIVYDSNALRWRILA